MPPFPEINPPLINSACLWASTLSDIEALYTSQYTGAVSTRTACHPTNKFPEDKSIHQHAFTSSSRGVLPHPPPSDPELNTTHPAPGPQHDLSDVSSVNNYGYAPLGLTQYVYMAKDLERKYPDIVKPIIFSVTGDSRTVADCWTLLSEHHHPSRQWCMEINLSCPNIPGKPPPAYSKQQLKQFLDELREHISRYVLRYTEDLARDEEERDSYWQERLLRLKIPIGIQLPPYTYAGQFDDVVEVIQNFNSEGFGIAAPNSRSDATASRARTNVPGMNAQAIDPTLLSSIDVDNYVSELSLNMQNKLSLGGALSESARQVPTEKGKSFQELLGELLKSNLGELIQEEIFSAPWPIAFVTATNTLGSALIMEESGSSWLPALRGTNGTGSGLGGLAGAALHPLALGNVANLRKRLGSQNTQMGDVKIIGVGGVSDHDGFERMKAAGADVVGLATALGAQGVAIFEAILAGDD